ncbi:MAG: coenzyme F420-0:L-glutamate ligase [Burkholderiales bacterium]|nr:coenzyme F420-0:L-glutamate ligase [Burkholderiales bacterium]
MLRAGRLELFALPAFPLVSAGDDLAAMIVVSAAESDIGIADGDVIAIAQKVVSKAEDRFVDLASIEPSARALSLAQATHKDPRLVEVILGESRRVVRSKLEVLIVEHRRGYVMANAGVDQSNVGRSGEGEYALRLPEDPDASAAALCSSISKRTGKRIAVVINDSFGRAWRVGTVGVALGVAGLPSIVDKRGSLDLYGRTLQATIIGFADEVAAAASLVMGQADEAWPVVVIRGLEWSAPPLPASSLIRPAVDDLFR